MRVEIEMTNQIFKIASYYLGRRYHEQSPGKIIKQALIELTNDEVKKDLAVIKMAIAAESGQKWEQAVSDLLV